MNESVIEIEFASEADAAFVYVLRLVASPTLLVFTRFLCLFFTAFSPSTGFVPFLEAGAAASAAVVVVVVV